MPAVQTSYPNVMPVGLPGMPATMTTWDADTKIVETALGIGFGRAVSQGTAENTIIVGGTLAGFRGITYRDITLIHSTSALLDRYALAENAGIMVRGDIWVDVFEAVLVTDIVTFDTATGQFGKTVGANITLAGCRWMRGAQGIGQLALLRLVRQV